jgi:hypothetical protein
MLGYALTSKTSCEAQTIDAGNAPTQLSDCTQHSDSVQGCCYITATVDGNTYKNCASGKISESSGLKSYIEALKLVNPDLQNMVVDCGNNAPKNVKCQLNTIANNNPPTKKEDCHANSDSTTSCCYATYNIGATSYKDCEAGDISAYSAFDAILISFKATNPTIQNLVVDCGPNAPNDVRCKTKSISNNNSPSTNTECHAYSDASNTCCYATFTKGDNSYKTCESFETRLVSDYFSYILGSYLVADPQIQNLSADCGTNISKQALCESKTILNNNPPTKKEDCTAIYDATYACCYATYNIGSNSYKDCALGEKKFGSYFETLLEAFKITNPTLENLQVDCGQSFYYLSFIAIGLIALLF